MTYYLYDMILHNNSYTMYAHSGSATTPLGLRPRTSRKQGVQHTANRIHITHTSTTIVVWYRQRNSIFILTQGLVQSNARTQIPRVYYNKWSSTGIERRRKEGRKKQRTDSSEIILRGNKTRSLDGELKNTKTVAAQ